VKGLAVALLLLLVGCCTPHPKEHPPAPDLAKILEGLPDTSLDNPEYDTPLTPFTEPVMLLENEHGWQIEEIKVPVEVGEKAFICFRLKDVHMLECLYKDTKDGDVEMKWVLPEKEKT
jgi:hypothetical protein